MAETILSFGLEKLWNLLVRESERFQGVEEQFNELKSDINMLRCFLEDASAKTHTSAMVRNTIKEIKEIVCDAEDIIETFLLKEGLGNTSDIRNSVRRFSCVILERKGLAFDMEALSNRISKVIRHMKILGVQQVITNEGYTQSLQKRKMKMRQTFSNDNEGVLVGLEGNVKILVGYSVNEDSNSQVVSITGMGGIGKTTLARQVFNHETINSHFEGLAWVSVSQQFTREYVWRTILQKLRPECKVSKMTEDELHKKLFQVLETQKALVVLDDMWTEEDWDLIKPMFPQEKEYKVDEEMEEMGKRMISHCGGLPLAVKVLGGLLTSQSTLREWKRIYENIKAHIIEVTSFSDKNISAVLYMSFEELPIYLKQCFLYLSYFPEDDEIDVEKLSYYWAAEGIPRPRYYDGASIRDIANGYIEELVKRNMIISKRDVGSSRFETFHLHDMMREVCLLKAEEDNFVQTSDASTYTAISTSQSQSRSRRLIIRSPDQTKVTMEGYNPKLRSLLFIMKEPMLIWNPSGSSSTFTSLHWMASGLCFTKLQLMRVLDLSRAEFEGEKLPSNIGKLIHLRYLSLYLARVTQLPSSIRNLKLLLYLNLHVDAKCPVQLPNVLKELQELRYLALPANLQEKTKLELGNLINLETFKNFSTKHNSLKDLHRMKRLKSLSILLNGERCTMETLPSCLGGLRNKIEDLTARDEKGDGSEFDVNFAYLVGLGEKSFCGRIMFCSIGLFPQLQKLDLHRLYEWEEWIVEEGSMPLLHTLSICYCPKLKELPDGLRFITSLKELTVVTTKREFKEKLSRGGEDSYKIQHIPLCNIKFDKNVYI
ncbi:unnamed protein product [Microthlaspi erraticum]|uniref:NB-ARC domain-containing protein n=1 Tax=Microthlaspi erraticum TaxID=1685480 RepID=A0A6D2K412_9BRAS|nr:unnamed protein product [Microthlaspi erraticum]